MMMDLVARFPALERLGVAPRRRIPVVQQLAATECGLACLAMVLGYHGRDTSLEQLRESCPVSRDGVNAADLIESASLLGLRGRGLRLEPDELAQVEPGSTILHWNFEHFVVLAGVRKDGIDIVDPRDGRRRVPMAEFNRSFTGIALTFEPTDLFVRQKRSNPLFPALKQAIKESGLLPRILVTSLILQLFGLGLPLLTGQIIDRVLPRADFGLFGMMVCGMAALVLLRTVGEMVRGHLLLHMRVNLDTKLTLGFIDHLVSLPYSFFQLRTAGDLMMRLNSNTMVRETLTSTAVSGVLDGLSLVIYLVILLFGNGPMATAALLAGGLDVAAFFVVRARQRVLVAEDLQAESKAQSYEVEMLTAMETLKAGGTEQHAVRHWSNLFVDQMNVKIKRDLLTIKTDALVGAVRMGGPLAILTVGALQVLDGRLSLGGMMGLSALAGSFLHPLGSLVQLLLSLEMARGYIERVNDVLDAKPEQPPGALRVARPLSGQVSLHRVSFAYGPHAPPVVSDISFDVRPGQFVAIVGPSGSGKTTLANLILGLQRPAAGTVSYDGTDLTDLDLRSVRRQFGVVNQNLSLFGASIRENISLGDSAIGLPQIEAAARLACVHDDIMSFPMGYNTQLLDRGGALSGGQRQRLALARALVRRPAMLLLDEATSALDAVTERRLQASLETLDCTRIVIAHRLSTVKAADVILVLEGGRVVESGTHAQLVAARGSYAQLVAAQMDRPEPVHEIRGTV
jgi:ATP-binding cassette subfamily B protein